MRITAFAAAALSAALAVSPAVAAKLRFTPDTFQIYGGLNNPDAARQANRRTTRETVRFQTSLKPGSIVVRTAERRLYLVLGAGQAIAYPVGVGREGFTWSGTNRITRKSVWPEWRPPQVMLEREHAKGHMIPDFMAGGPDNPLGARALYIGNTEYRIHGTTQPWSIGLAVSSGCIRMMNDQIIDLFNRVKVGAVVVVE